jgi:hypothetical protein
VQGHALGAKKKLGRAKLKGVIAAMERIPQDCVHQLVEKHRRYAAGTIAD